MMFLKNPLIFIGLLLLSLPATAFFYSGNDLKSKLEEDGYSKGIGTGFIVGVADTISLLDYVCMPSGPTGVNVGQLRDVVLKYLRANPEKLHKPAADLVYTALHDNWPCKKSSGADSPSSSTAPTPPAPKPRPKPKEESSPF